MHIQESHQTHNNTQAKCFKMTEDGRKKSGMNGIIDGGSGNVGAAIKQSAPRNDIEQRGASGSTGGRLKFFKDGKFILELARAREGERVSWVSVPRKTFWPPQASSISTPPTVRQESSTSLSVSDDNSSVQSSPWQRDHSWKQNSPRCNVSSEMTFFYHRPSKVHIPVARKKRRRPFDASDLNKKLNIRTCADLGQDECDSSSVQFNKIVKIKVNDVKNEDAISTDNNHSSDNNKTKQRQLLNNKKQRKLLIDVVKVLWDKKPQVNTFKSVLLSNIRHEQMVSPRKRILRELERVTIDDLTNKRSRAKSAQSITFATSTTGSSPSRAHNGTAETTATKPTSSYSITSLLGYKKEDETTSSPSPSSSSNVSNNEYRNRTSPNVSQRMLMNTTNISSSPKNVNYSHTPKVLARHDSPSPDNYRYLSSAHLQQTVAHHSSPTHALSPPPDIYKLYKVSPNHSYSSLHGLVMNQKSPQYYTPSRTAALSPNVEARSPPPHHHHSEERVRDYRLSESSEKVDNLGQQQQQQRILEMEHALRPSYIPPYLYSPAPSPYVSHPVAYYTPGAYRNLYHQQNPYHGNLTHHPPPSSPQPRNYSTRQSWSNASQNHSPLDTVGDDISSDVPLNLSKNAG